MKRFIIAAAACVGVVGVWSLTTGWAQDIHNHSENRTNGPGRGDEFSPPGGGMPGCRNGRCPIGPGFRDAGRNFGPNRGRVPVVTGKTSPLDLRTLAFRFEYAAEIAAQDMAAEFPRTRFTAELLDAADDLQKQARHFRISVDRGADVAHLKSDFQGMEKSFVALSKPVRQMRRAFLVERDLWRANGLLRQIAARMQPQNGGAGNGQPGPSLPRATMPKQPVIPTNMKGIAQLPVAQQAAALAQKTCPVTGGLLGSHGKPLAVMINGKVIFVCCQGCIADLKQNPGKYLQSR